MAVKTEELVLSQAKLDDLKNEYLADSKNTVVRHALINNPIDTLVRVNEQKGNVTRVYSVDVPTMRACNQKQSGRCWIFSALNLVRELVAKKINIDNFELSQNYIGYYDKLEKFNFLLTELILNVKEPLDERLNFALLATGIADGGQWDMFVNVIKKYGICPKPAFEETFQAFTTLQSNKMLNALARKFAYEVRQDGVDAVALKDEYVKKAHGILSSAYGVPPTSFDYDYKDKDGVYHVIKDCTPKAFFDKYIGEEIDEYQSIINAPTPDKEYLETYTIDHLGNVVGGKKIKHLNLTMDRIESLIIASLKAGEPVWFGSDVANYGDRAEGVWDDKSFDYDTPFDMNFNFGKSAMLQTGQSVMNHAMLITGVSLDEEGNPLKWKIENSWGEDRGDKGYYIMSSSWFKTFVYQAVINKKYLTEEEVEASKKEPHVVPLWDPFGTLAE